MQPLLERAARKAGLEIEPAKRALADIPALVLPALLDDAGRHDARAARHRP